MLSLKSRMKMLDAKRTESTERQSPRIFEAAPSPSPRSQQAGPAADQAVTTSSQGSKYLIISVIEARNLVAKDYDTHSSDPFVKITLGNMSKKTRAIYRNCQPLWVQRLVFPISGLSEAEPLLVELFDKDVTGKEFLGQVIMTLGKALEIESDEAQRGSYWLVLSKKRSTDIVGGELCLGFEVNTMEHQQHTQYLAELEAQLNPDTLAATYSSKALHIQLKGINGLAASGLFAGARGKSTDQQLSLFIKYGRVMLEKPLPSPTNSQHVSEDDPSNSYCADTASAYELVVNEEVVIPLAAAVRAVPLVARKKDELTDIKLYLKSHDTLIAKTQIPITAVPISPTGPAHPPSDDTTTCSQPPTGAVTPPPLSARVTHEATTHKVSEGTECFTASSVPNTPRGPTSEYGPPVGSLCSSSSLLADLPSSPAARVRPDTFEINIHSKRLGTAGGSSNLSTVSTCSHSSSTGTAYSMAADVQYSPGGVKMVVEGSLDSVTAASRVHSVQSPAGLQGRRVQGLAEMHEGSVLRKPLKAMFVQPREVNRTGWVPTKTAEDSDEAHSPDCQHSGSRCFCRMMESTVPMYCNLEVSLNLAVVEHKVAMPDSMTGVEVSTGSAGSGTVCDGDDSVSDDEEEALQAMPIQPPAPCDLVLQDVILQGIGVNRLYALLVSADSEMMREHHAAQQVTEVKVGPWRSAAGGCGYQRVRDVSYTKRLNIPLPLAPEKCHVWEEHRLLTKEAGGWVVHVICKNDAPKGDCFEAHMQMCGVYISRSSSRLRVSMQLNWTKNTWGKSMVQGAAETDAKRGYASLVKLLQQQARSGAIGSCPGTDALVAAQVTGPACDAVGTAAMPTAGQGGWQMLRSNAGVLLQLALVMSVLLLAWAVLSAGRHISSELHEMVEAMKACSVPGQGVPVQHGLL